MDEEPKQRKKQTKKHKETKLNGKVNQLENYLLKDEAEDKYKLKPPQQMSDTELLGYLRLELDQLNLQARDIDLRRACVEDNLREIQNKINKFFIFSSHKSNNNFQYLLEEIPTTTDVLGDFDIDLFLFDDEKVSEQTNMPLRGLLNYKTDSSQFLMNQVPLEIVMTQNLVKNQSLWKYFNYNEELQESLNNLENIEQDNLVKLAEYFGLKPKVGTKGDIKKLKISLQEIKLYCQDQTFSGKIKRIYKPTFLQKLDIQQK